MPKLVISLDFEMFWGVTDSKTIESYGKNVEGEWNAIPALLALFKKYDIHATWATVGMLMCKDYKQWCDMRPSNIAIYKRDGLSTYSFSTLARDYPRLFFGRPLVEQILVTNGQELASHSYSHFYAGEHGVTVQNFAADVDCNRIIFDEMGVRQPTSFVFPRNQVSEECLSVLSTAGFKAYRGNQEHWLYRSGSSGSRSYYGRFARFADDYLPLTGSHVTQLPSKKNGVLVNIPASRFLRPSKGSAILDQLHLARVKRSMLEAAQTDGIFHLWWHPHNFGLLTDSNLKNLECILSYYRVLNQKYGMRSLTMQELSQ
jgi:peptidoglycan/xylan/chitin deacetylase (PgdA/CDA1 family)